MKTLLLPVFAFTGMLFSHVSNAQWTDQTSNTTVQLNAAAFKTELVGVAVGDGAIVKTSDGGTTWTVKTPTGLYQDVTFSGGDTVVAVGNGGAIVISYDAGDTWNVVSSANGRTNLSIRCKNHVCHITTSGGYVEKSIDNGVTWTNVAAYNTGWNNIYDMDWFGDTVYLSGSKPAKYAYSYDNGANWTTNTLMATEYPTANAKGIQFPENSSTGFFIHQIDKAYKTTDAMANITTIDMTIFFPTPNYFNSTTFTSNTKGYIAGASGIYATNDGGTTWIKESTKGAQMVTVIGNATYSVGAAGSIMKKTNSTTGFITINEETAFSIYPNPTSDILHINKKMDKIMVTDMQGRIYLTASHKQEMIVGSLPAGIYLVELVAGNETKTLKFIKE